MKFLFYALKPWHWAVIFGGGLWMFWLALQRNSPFQALIATVPLGLPLARLLLEAPEAAMRWVKRVRYAEWNGRHFVFNNIQIRVFWDDTVIWLHADDLFYALAQKPDLVSKRKLGARLGAEHFNIPHGTKDLCFSEDGIFRYLASMNHEDAWRCRRWLQREVLPNIRKLREIGSGHYDQFELASPAAIDMSAETDKEAGKQAPP